MDAPPVHRGGWGVPASRAGGAGRCGLALAACALLAWCAPARAAVTITPVAGSPFDLADGFTPYHRVAFSPDGQLLAAANYAAGTVSVFAVASGGALTSVASPVPTPSPASVAFSPDGKLLAAANYEAGTVSVFAVGPGGTLTLVGSPVSAPGLPFSLAFSPDGKLLATANKAALTVSVFAVGSGGALTPVASRATPSAPVSVAFSPDGKLLATANDPRSVSVFAVGPGGMLTDVGAPAAVSGPIWVAFSPDGKLLAAANSPAAVSVFALGPGGALTPVPAATAPTDGLPFSLAFSPDGKLLLTANYFGNDVSVFAVGAGGALTVARPPLGSIHAPSSVAFSPDGMLLAVGAGTPSVWMFNVDERADQSIVFPPLGPFTAGQGPVALGASASAGLSVSYSVVSGPCSVSGSTLTLGGAGSCVVAADQAGNAAFRPAATVTQTVVIRAAPQSISFAPPGPFTFGQPPVALVASASSGLPVVFSVVSGPCSVSGATLTINGAGSCVVAADQAGSATFAPATQVTRTIVVNKADQSIVFPPQGPYSVGQPPVALGAAASSGLPVSYSVVSGPCSVSGSTLTIAGAGSCVVAASQAGSANFNAAAPQSITITIKANQTVIFPQAGPFTFGQGPVALGATASSGLPVSYSISSGPCSVSGATLTLAGEGACVVAADQAGGAGFNAAPTVTRTITIKGPTSTVVSCAPATLALGGSSTCSATVTDTAPVGASNPTGAVAFSASGGTLGAAICAASGATRRVCTATLAPPGIGRVAVTASFAGDPLHAASDSTGAPFAVTTRYAGGHMTLTKTPVRRYGAAPFRVAFTYALVNDGSDTLYHVGVSDPSCGTVVYQSGDVNGDQLLQPGETYTYTCSEVVSTPATYTTTATASASDAQTGLAVSSNTASATFTVTASAFDGGHLTLYKAASPASGPAPLAVTYTYTLVNDGSDPLLAVALSDDSCPTPTLVSGDNSDPGILDPGEAWSYRCAQTLTAPGAHTNTAAAVASDTQTGQTVNSNTATATATVTVPGSPATTGAHLTLAKTASPSSGPAPLGVLYTFTATNDGTETLFHLTVTDDACAPVSYQSGDANHDQLIQPGEQWIYSCQQTLTAPGSHTDTASAHATSTATGTDTDSNTATATANVT